MECARVQRGLCWTALAVVLFWALLWGQAVRAGDAPGAVQDGAAPTEFAVIEEAQALVTAGKYAEAAKFLEDRLWKYKDSDLLYSLQGRAFLLSGKVEQAGDSFRKALEINPNSEAAKRYLEQVNRTLGLMENKTESEFMSQLMATVNDKMFYVVCAGLAGLASLFSKKLMLAAKGRRFDRALRDQKYHELTDSLAYMLKHSRKVQLRQSLAKMQEILTPPEIEKIIIDYVDDQQVEDDLLYIFRKMAQKAQ